MFILIVVLCAVLGGAALLESLEPGFLRQVWRALRPSKPN